jgi:Winged helix DNA-binding domain
VRNWRISWTPSAKRRPLWGVPSAAQVQKRIERLGEDVTVVDVDGTSAYLLAAAAPGLARAVPSRSVRLLPAFDQYVVTATQQADQLTPGPFSERIYRPQGWLSPVLLVGGRMDGVWRKEAKGRRLRVTIEPSATLPAWARRAAEAEAERLAAWNAAQLDLDWAEAR